MVGLDVELGAALAKRLVPSPKTGRADLPISGLAEVTIDGGR
jgi:hypothetical protein